MAEQNAKQNNKEDVRELVDALNEDLALATALGINGPSVLIQGA